MEPQPKKSRAQHTCEKCGKVFSQRQHLQRHVKSIHNKGNKHKCPVCSVEFSRADNLTRHLKRQSCTKQTGGTAVQQLEEDHMQEAVAEESLKEKASDEQALGGTIRKRVIQARGMENLDPMTYLEVHFDEVKKILTETIKERGALKWYLSIQIKMSRRQGDQVETVEPHFRGKCQIALKHEDLDEAMRDSIKKMCTSFMEYQRRGSNWLVDKVKDVTIRFARYRPLGGSSYISLSTKLKRKHAIVNPQNRDNRCFLWSVLAALHPVKNNSQRISSYREYKDELDFNGIKFPVTLADIAKFETQNRISVNVFGYEKWIFPLHVTKQRYDRHVNLLMISDGKKSHYCWVKNLSRLLGDQHTHANKYHYCPYCLTGFTKTRILHDHTSYCISHGEQKIDLPKEKDKWLFYKDIRKQLKVPYVIYGDFESLQVPISGCRKNPDKSSTEKLTHHVACGFAYKVVGLTPKLSKELVKYRGPDAAEKFVEYMLKEQEEIEKKFKEAKPLVMSGRDWQTFKKATCCHICKEKLGNDRVRDHCHMTGMFRGPAHRDCNINYKFTGRIPVILHNNRGYDSHLILQALGKVNKELKCIPNHMEKYISFSLGCMDFIDSFQFMPSTLEKLIENLDKEKFKNMTQYFGKNRLGILMRKLAYPYEYIDSETRFTEAKLPPKKAFYSTLSNEDITEEDYEHAQKVWNEFDIKNLGQYHDLYVATDVLALADVFENFREMCLTFYDLDAAHYYTSPGLAWQAALKMTGVKLELLTDIDMHLFIEQGIRGGISMITHRYAKANNKCVPDYDPDKPSCHLIYLDANNLYGWAMSQSLPTHRFCWMNEDEFPDVTLVADDAEEGYILEVDLEYPQELHDEHNDYPLAPEKVKVTEDMLSPYAKKLIEDLGTKGTSVEKLIPNLRKKEKYVVHFRNLKLYLSLGMKLTKIHRVMAFQQSPWLKTYIDFNTEKRKQAKSEFEKDFFKLMNNSVFGKTMENLRKRVDVKLVNDQIKAKKLICKPSFHAFRIFNENLVAIHMKKQKLYLNRPIYVGISILDISKVLMYDFHYNYIKTKYGSDAKLLFTDTDSLCYAIQTEDIYEDMLEKQELFDTSGYEENHPLYSTVNNKILGKMKDETNGIPVREFIGLKSKMYSLVYGDNQEKKTAKGISKSVIKYQTRHEHYRDALFSRKIHMSQMTQIRSYGHQLYNVSLNKIGLSPFDDKRFLLEDGISSLAYGHCKIKSK